MRFDILNNVNSVRQALGLLPLTAAFPSSTSENYKHQLRDRLGKWIEMGSEVKFDGFATKITGNVVGFSPDGSQAEVESPYGSFYVPGDKLEVVAAKAHLPGTGWDEGPHYGKSGDRPDEGYSPFSDPRLDGLINYTGLEYENINLAARTNNRSDASTWADVESIDRLIAGNKTTEPLSLWRGINSPRRKDAYTKLPLGAIISDDGFVSTSPNIDVSMSFAIGKHSINDQNVDNAFLIRIDAPSGTPAVNVDDMLGMTAGYEEEILLGRRSRFRVKGHTYANLFGDTVPVGYKKSVGQHGDAYFIPVIDVEYLGVANDGTTAPAEAEAVPGGVPQGVGASGSGSRGRSEDRDAALASIGRYYAGITAAFGGGSNDKTKYNYKHQLRDKFGKWIEMGGDVKWATAGVSHFGKATGFDGDYVVVDMKQSDGSVTPVKVHHSQIEEIADKAHLGVPPAGVTTGPQKPDTGVPDFDMAGPVAVGKNVVEEPKAKELTTVEELEALPVGAIVNYHTPHSGVSNDYKKFPDGLWNFETAEGGVAHSASFKSSLNQNDVSITLKSLPDSKKQEPDFDMGTVSDFPGDVPSDAISVGFSPTTYKSKGFIKKSDTDHHWSAWDTDGNLVGDQYVSANAATQAAKDGANDFRPLKTTDDLSKLPPNTTIEFNDPNGESVDTLIWTKNDQDKWAPVHDKKSGGFTVPSSNFGEFLKAYNGAHVVSPQTKTTDEISTGEQLAALPNGTRIKFDGAPYTWEKGPNGLWDAVEDDGSPTNYFMASENFNLDFKAYGNAHIVATPETPEPDAPNNDVSSKPNDIKVQTFNDLISKFRDAADGHGVPQFSSYTLPNGVYVWSENGYDPYDNPNTKIQVYDKNHQPVGPEHEAKDLYDGVNAGWQAIKSDLVKAETTDKPKDAWPSDSVAVSTNTGYILGHIAEDKDAPGEWKLWDNQGDMADGYPSYDDALNEILNDAGLNTDEVHITDPFGITTKKPNLTFFDDEINDSEDVIAALMALKINGKTANSGSMWTFPDGSYVALTSPYDGKNQHGVLEFWGADANNTHVVISQDVGLSLVHPDIMAAKITDAHQQYGEPAPNKPAHPKNLGDSVKTVSDLDELPTSAEVSLGGNFFKKLSNGYWEDTNDGLWNAGVIGHDHFANGEYGYVSGMPPTEPAGPKYQAGTKLLLDEYNTPHLLDIHGGKIYKGTVVRSTKDGKSGVITKLEPGGNGVHIKDAETGKTLVRNIKTLEIFNAPPGKAEAPNDLEKDLVPGDKIYDVGVFDELPVGAHILVGDITYTKIDADFWENDENGNQVGGSYFSFMADQGDVTLESLTPVPPPPIVDGGSKFVDHNNILKNHSATLLPIGSQVAHVDNSEEVLTKVANNSWEGTSGDEFISDGEIEDELGSVKLIKMGDGDVPAPSSTSFSDAEIAPWEQELLYGVQIGHTIHDMNTLNQLPIGSQIAFSATFGSDQTYTKISDGMWANVANGVPLEQGNFDAAVMGDKLKLLSLSTESPVVDKSISPEVFKSLPVGTEIVHDATGTKYTKLGDDHWEDNEGVISKDNEFSYAAKKGHYTVTHEPIGPPSNAASLIHPQSPAELDNLPIGAHIQYGEGPKFKKFSNGLWGAPNDDFGSLGGNDFKFGAGSAEWNVLPVGTAEPKSADDFAALPAGSVISYDVNADAKHGFTKLTNGKWMSNDGSGTEYHASSFAFGTDSDWKLVSTPDPSALSSPADLTQPAAPKFIASEQEYTDMPIGTTIAYQNPGDNISKTQYIKVGDNAWKYADGTGETTFTDSDFGTEPTETSGWVTVGDAVLPPTPGTQATPAYKAGDKILNVGLLDTLPVGTVTKIGDSQYTKIDNGEWKSAVTNSSFPSGEFDLAIASNELDIVSLPDTLSVGTKLNNIEQLDALPNGAQVRFKTASGPSGSTYTKIAQGQWKWTSALGQETKGNSHFDLVSPVGDWVVVKNDSSTLTVGQKTTAEMFDNYPIGWSVKGSNNGLYVKTGPDHWINGHDGQQISSSSVKNYGFDNNHSDYVVGGLWVPDDVSTPKPTGPSMKGAQGTTLYKGGKAVWTTKGDVVDIVKFENNGKGVVVFNPITGKKHAVSAAKLKGQETGTPAPGTIVVGQKVGSKERLNALPPLTTIQPSDTSQGTYTKKPDGQWLSSLTGVSYDSVELQPYAPTATILHLPADVPNQPQTSTPNAPSAPATFTPPPPPKPFTKAPKLDAPWQPKELEKDPSSPWFEAEVPSPPVSVADQLPNAPDGWLDKVEARYQSNPLKVKPTLQQSNNWGLVQSVMNAGDEKALKQLLDGQYLDQPLYDEEMAHLTKIKTEKEAIQAKYDIQAQKYQNDLKAWKTANGIGFEIFAGAAPVSTTPFTGGDADWTKAHPGTPTAAAAFEALHNSNDLARRGTSFVTDSGQIEDLDVRAMRVVSADPELGIQLELKFKLTAEAGDQISTALGSRSDVEQTDLMQYQNMEFDTKTGLHRYINSLKYTEGGKTYAYVHEGTGARVSLTRSKTGKTGISPHAMHNQVRIFMPDDATPEDMQKVLSDLGISQSNPATEADVRAYAANKLISVAGGFTDPTKNHEPGSAQFNSALANIKAKYGIGPEDMRLGIGAQGRTKMFMPDAIRDQIISDTNLTSLNHNVAAGSDPERWLAILTGPGSGLHATNVRWSEGYGGSGMSSGADMGTGGADYLFTKPVHGAPKVAGHQIVMHPKAAARRTDLYGNYSDQYGRHFDNIDVYALMKGQPYEIMVKHDIPVSEMWYVTMSADTREKLLKRLHNQGITHINGMPVEEFVLTQGMQPPQLDTSIWDSDDLPTLEQVATAPHTVEAAF